MVVCFCFHFSTAHTLNHHFPVELIFAQGDGQGNDISSFFFSLFDMNIILIFICICRHHKNNSFFYCFVLFFGMSAYPVLFMNYIQYQNISHTSIHVKIVFRLYRSIKKKTTQKIQKINQITTTTTFIILCSTNIRKFKTKNRISKYHTRCECC